MSIKLATAPTDGIAIVQQGLATLHRVSPRRAMLGGALVNASVHHPQPVYTFTLEALAKGAALSTAELTGWRYLISDGKEPMEVASLSPRLEGGGFDFAGVNQGPVIAEASTAMIAAEKLDVVNERDFEVRWLQIPGIYVQAVWLKDLAGSEDRLVPFHVRPPFRNNDPYTVKNFLTLVQDMARVRLQFPDAPYKK